MCIRDRGSWIEYRPLTTVADGSPIEFDVGTSGEDYIDFANTTLYVKAKITRADGTNLALDFPIGPSNLFLHSLFRKWTFLSTAISSPPPQTPIRIAP